MKCSTTQRKAATQSLILTSSVRKCCRGVLDAAQEKSSPVILAYAEVFEPICPMEEFTPMLRAAAERAGVPVAVHLDHARRFEYIQKAVDNGFTSVMLDASDLPLEENIALTEKVVRLCRPLGISVEVRARPCRRSGRIHVFGS